MTDELRISDDLALPLSAVTEPLAIVARRGRGKTYAGLKMKEQMQKAGQQTCTVEPLDVWYGIRSSRDGKGEGFPVVIFGGDHADVDLTPNMGREVADFLVNESFSTIIVPDFETNQDTVEFMTAFLDRLLKTNRDPLHLFFDEAEAFAPERPAKYEARMLGAMGRLVKRGRVRGLGATLITQRTASLNKNVLSQVGGLLIMALSSPWDRAPVERWMASNGSPEQMDALKDDLASLPLGEGYFWHPDWDIFKRIKIAERETFDSSATPEVGQKRVIPKTWADVDVPKVTERFKAQVERRKAEDPVELKKTIAELRKDLRSAEQKAASTGQAEPPEPVEVQVPFEVPVALLEPQEVEALKTTLSTLRTMTEKLTLVTDAFDDRLAKLDARAPEVKPAPIKSAPKSQPRPAVQPSRPPAPDVEVDTDFTPTKPQQRILNALAWMESIGRDSTAKTQLALLADARPTSGAYKNNLGALRSAGLISYPVAGQVALTGAGQPIAVVDGVPQSNEELWDAIFAKVGPTKTRILQVVIEIHPDMIDKDSLAAETDQRATSGAYKNNLGFLRTMGLIDYPRAGFVTATDALFLTKERVA